MPSDSSSEDAVSVGQVAVANVYTKLHLSALSFLHPPTAPTTNQCPCEAIEEPRNLVEQDKILRVYHTEPSGYNYNAGCYLVKESRYSTGQHWHAPADDLVADDAAAGSPIAAIGWWVDIKNEVWETRVYYVDKDGRLRERTSRSFFAHTDEDESDIQLPKPEKLIPPTPGWKLTPCTDSNEIYAESNERGFPEIQPLPDTKLAAVHSEDKTIRVFFQAKDSSIHEIIYSPKTGWSAGLDTSSSDGLVVGPNKAKPGTPLTAVSGGWAEVRLFYVDIQNQLAQVYGDDPIRWVEYDSPRYSLSSTAMLAAVAWNYGSPLFRIRIYTTGDNDELYELSYARNAGGWDPNLRLVSKIRPARAAYIGYGDSVPLSAVSAVLVEGDWKTKVYFHPRRTLMEWDVCNELSLHTSIQVPSKKAAQKREIEEQTRVMIAEELVRQEEERKRQEEEERKIREEEEERKERQKRKMDMGLPQVSQQAIQQLQEYVHLPVGGTIDLEQNPELDQVFKEATNCHAGYEWIRTETGWKCSGGSHKLTNEQFDALKE